LKNIVIRAKNTSVKEHTQSTQMGKLEIPISTMKKVPTIAGEGDVLKVLQLTPGIKRGGEGTIGMYVRGGGNDENLILLDEATVYNAGHLLGFFSVFNTNAIKDIGMYKSGFPSNYGGRLSSVMDIKMKEGNKNKFQTEGSLGLISSNLTIQGPIKKDKVSFMLSGRRTYIDQVFKLVKIQIPYYFYDLNAKVNWSINKRNKLFFSTYLGNDVLKLSADDVTSTNTNGSDSTSTSTEAKSSSKLGNFTTTLRWNHIFKNQKLFLNTTLLQTKFQYSVGGNIGGTGLGVESRIQDYGVKLNFSYNANPKNEIKFGTEIINHTFAPNVVSTSETSIDKNAITNNSTETSIYVLNDRVVTNNLKLNIGGRLSSEYTQSTFYKSFEPRVALRYKLNETNSIKASYSKMTQYMHLVSSSSIALPTDLWYPVTKKVKPEFSDQYSWGYYSGISKHNILLSAEVYYKKMKNLIEYKEGAVLILNNNFESELVNGRGEAYGLELFANKSEGRFAGWVGYTLSWATRQFDSINRGKEYYARYDRRHDFSIVAMYEISKSISISGVWVFSSGNPFTARIGQYIMPNPSNTSVIAIPIYSGKNEYRLSNAHRLDFDLCVKAKQRKNWQGEWHFSAYNLYNRTQPSRLRLKLIDGTYKYQQTGLFGVIPSISYNFKF
jgi:hypothetical protein